MAWKGLDFFPHDTRIDFMRLRRICFFTSVAMMVASLVLFLVPGMNYGIDFKGGSLVEIKNKSGPADLSELRSKLGTLGLGDVQIQTFGEPDDVLIRVETQPGGETAQQGVVNKIRGLLGDTVEYRRVEVVGPAVSNELRTSGILAVSVSLIAIMIYMWFRFEWQFAVGVVVALIHDVLLTVGVFAILQLEFDLSVIAALLTIVGYSVNDSVVVSDRIRENLRKFKRMPLDELINLSTNETLSRTILTSGFTMIVLVALFLFGGEVLRQFSFAMLFGIFVGTYSSIFIAAPMLVWFGIRRDPGAAAGPKPAADDAQLAKGPEAERTKTPEGARAKTPEASRAAS